MPRVVYHFVCRHQLAVRVYCDADWRCYTCSIPCHENKSTRTLFEEFSVPHTIDTRLSHSFSISRFDVLPPQNFKRTNVHHIPCVLYGRVYIKIKNRLLKFKSFRGEYFEWDFNRDEQKFDFSMNMLLSEEKYVLIFVEIIFFRAI